MLTLRRCYARLRGLEEHFTTTWLSYLWFQEARNCFAAARTARRRLSVEMGVSVMGFFRHWNTSVSHKAQVMRTEVTEWMDNNLAVGNQHGRAELTKIQLVQLQLALIQLAQAQFAREGLTPVQLADLELALNWVTRSQLDQPAESSSG